MPPLTVSTKQLSQRSGLPFRQVQNFTEAGILLADEGAEAPGRGGSRQYPLSEVEVAMLLSGISHKGMAVSEAYGIANTIRPIVRAPDDFRFNGLEQARKLNRYLNSRLAMQRMPGGPDKFIPEPHAYLRHVGVIAELELRWAHVEPSESNLRRIRAWMALDLAKQGKADPTFFLHRGAEETWCVDIWIVLPITDAGRLEYHFGNTVIDVRNVEADKSSTDQIGEQPFDDLLVELTTGQTTHRKNLRGGYVIMPRCVYASSTLDSN